MAGLSVSSLLADQLAARVADLTAPENRDDFGAYLDRLEARYPHDKAMTKVVARSRAALAAATTPTPTPHPEMVRHGSVVSPSPLSGQAPRADTAAAEAGAPTPACGASH